MMDILTVVLEAHTVASQLIAAFVDGLRTYKQWGPPGISSIPLSLEEIDHVKQFNLNEMRFSECQVVKEELLRTDLKIFDEQCIADCSPTDKFTKMEDSSHSCCVEYLAVGSCSTGVAGEERVQEFKKAQGINESGLEV